MREYIDKLLCKWGFHELKPWDCEEWGGADKNYQPSEKWSMRWRCQKCIDLKGSFVDIEEPTPNQIKEWNRIATWPKDRSVYLEKLPKY